MAVTTNAAEVLAALEETIAKAITQISTEVTANLIEATPVDTGWARANWIPNIGGPGNSSRERAQDASQVGGARSQQEAGTASLFSYTFGGGDVYVTNNVPYIVRLNEGSSAQAPASFVQRAIQDSVNSLTSLAT